LIRQASQVLDEAALGIAIHLRCKPIEQRLGPIDDRRAETVMVTSFWKTLLPRLLLRASDPPSIPFRRSESQIMNGD